LRRLPPLPLLPQPLL